MMRWQDDLQFYFFHFMPYIGPPGSTDDETDSHWVDYSNAHFDPAIAVDLYPKYYREMALADRLGFDAVTVNEHHNTIYSLNPVCTLTAAVLTQITKQAKIGVFGAPPNFTNPMRLAEEYAMLDVMSGGRLEIAMPLGIGMEYWANTVNPVTARDRFHEAIDVMIQAWSEPGPTSFDGDFYSYRYLNIWPRPVQRPHPKLSMLGGGTPETVEYAARRGWGYSSVFVPAKVQTRTFQLMREMGEKFGKPVTPDKAYLNVLIYVAETDEQAEREALPHIEYFFSVLARTTPRYLVPPGYIGVDQFKARIKTAAQHGGFDWEHLKKDWRVGVGSPKTVAEKIEQWCEEVQSSRIISWLALGDMPHWKVVKNMTLFAEEVMPPLRALAGTRPASKAKPKSSYAKNGRRGARKAA